MDKSARKLDEQDPGMYIVRVSNWNLPKNKLQKEIVEHFRDTQHLSLLPAALFKEWVKAQKARVDYANKKHDRCKPVFLNHSERMFNNENFQLYTDFITVEVAQCRRMISAVQTETEQSA